MKILAFEFSSPQRSVALAEHRQEKGLVLAEAVETGALGANALTMTEAVLKEAQVEREQVECIAVGLGPGSYTGIRAAIALAQGWHLARAIKLVGVSSAECVALAAATDGVTGPLGVVIDAQRNEFYLAEWELSPGGPHEISPLRLVPAAAILEAHQRGSLIAGPEVTRWFPGGRIIYPRAALLAQMARDQQNFVPGEKLAPIYLRETSFVKAPPPRIVPD